MWVSAIVYCLQPRHWIVCPRPCTGLVGADDQSVQSPAVGASHACTGVARPHTGCRAAKAPSVSCQARQAPLHLKHMARDHGRHLGCRATAMSATHWTHWTHDTESQVQCLLSTLETSTQALACPCPVPCMAQGLVLFCQTLRPAILRELPRSAPPGSKASTVRPRTSAGNQGGLRPAPLNDP